MPTPALILFAGTLLAAPIQTTEVRKEDGPIRGVDFPRIAIMVQAFEARINAERVADREAVLNALDQAWVLPDVELTRFFQRVARTDADPWVRGTAVRKLYEMHIPFAVTDLPTTFNGHHRGHLIDRQAKDLPASLISQVKEGGQTGGYAAYVVGLLRVKEAIPALRDLAEEKNVFVRYSAGRALIECGDKEGGAVLKTILNHPIPPNSAIADIEDPYYQALAARAYAEIGPNERKAAIERLIGLMAELEAWQDINAQGRLGTTRRMLGQISGKYFLSHGDAQKWYDRFGQANRKP